MVRYVCLLLALCMVVACGPKVDPETGTWKYEEFKGSENTCNSDEVTNGGSGTFQLINKGDGTITVRTTDGTEDFDCTLRGKSLDCPERAYREENFFGAKFKIRISVLAEMADSKNMTGSQSGVVTCEGGTCGGIATQLKTQFPCNFKVNFSASWQSSTD